MKAYVTVLDGDDALLPFFVRHYRKLGATEFPLLVYGQPEHFNRARATIEAEGGVCSAIGVLPSIDFSARHREARIAQVHPAGQWAFFADLDEFAAMTPREVVHVIGRVPYVAGRWVDRVGPEGKLVDVDRSQPLEQQFPLAGRLRRQWSQGDAVFVLSPRAPTSHHPNACRWGKRHWPMNPLLDRVVDVHHFKWQTNVVARLERRLERIAAVGKSRTPWARRVEFMLAHVKQHQGVDPSLLWHVGSVLSI